MHRLVTSQQNIKLKQMLDDQNVSIENIDVEFEEVKPDPIKLQNPFQDDPKLGIKKITDDFNTWSEFYLNKPNGLF